VCGWNKWLHLDDNQLMHKAQCFFFFIGILHRHTLAIIYCVCMCAIINMNTFNYVPHTSTVQVGDMASGNLRLLLNNREIFVLGETESVSAAPCHTGPATRRDDGPVERRATGPTPVSQSNDSLTAAERLFLRAAFQSGGRLVKSGLFRVDHRGEVLRVVYEV